MKTCNFDIFELYVTGLKERVDDPVRFAFEKSGKQFDFSAHSAEELVFTADSGAYIAIQDLLLTAGTRYQVACETYVLVELVETGDGVAIWYATRAACDHAPALFTMPAAGGCNG